MPEPNQAQIEAAANAMIDCMFAPHELPIEGELWCKYFETAKAALTAAAGVERKHTGVLPDCMMPDGAEPCQGYQELRDEMELQIAAAALTPDKD